MSELLSQVIRIRVSHAQSMRLQQAAALAGLTFSDYVRRRLTSADAVADELALLRQAVHQLDGLQEARAGAIEAALLVRQQARPEHRAQVENTMQMLGVEPLARMP